MKKRHIALIIFIVLAVAGSFLGETFESGSTLANLVHIFGFVGLMGAGIMMAVVAIYSRLDKK